jgi:uroporphyrinogen-III decarboxylase
MPVVTPDCPRPAFHGGPLIETEEDYEYFKRYLYPDASCENVRKKMSALQRLNEEHEKGDALIWYSFDGFFWFPRTLLGIENHLYSFYDEPDLYHRICSDLADYIIAELPKIYEICTPDFMVISEDMSYNNGPMISEAQFNEFVLPYYQQMIPPMKNRGTRIFVDSDGDISLALPWFANAGVEGILPLERQAGVDLMKLRDQYPNFLFIGHYDKMAMPLGEEAMRAEFERLLPVMRQGGFIPSVDHQTPPGVSLENYEIYLRLLREYCEKAAQK